MAVVVKMLRMVLTSAELINGTCPRPICPCWPTFDFEKIINVIFRAFSILFSIFFFHCQAGLTSAELTLANAEVDSTIAGLIFQSKFTLNTIKNPIPNHFYYC